MVQNDKGCCRVRFLIKKCGNEAVYLTMSDTFRIIKRVLDYTNNGAISIMNAIVVIRIDF